MSERTPEEIAADIVSEACIVGFNMTGRAGSGDPDVLRELIAAAIRAERAECDRLRKKFEGK